MDKKVIMETPFCYRKVEKGAIVMNANPFTKGHRYLIEKAAEKVEYLYVFVVEEDASEFTFEDRYRLVKEGTVDLNNVCVLPSGEFIISKYSMSAYFDKEKLQKQIVDTEKDVAFFTNYITLPLNIKTRFVGEEPLDAVTRQYNEQIKKMFPYYGLKVEEIPRIKKDDTIISASLVRKWYKNQEWNNIETIVPKNTYDFLKTNPIMRDKLQMVEEQHKRMIISEKNKAEIKQIITENTNVVFYAIGKDCNYLFSMLKSKEKDKIIFCDIKAKKEKLILQGKVVVKPGELIKKQYIDSPIIITSTRYGVEIAKQLVDIGVNINRLYLNTCSSIEK